MKLAEVTLNINVITSPLGNVGHIKRCHGQ
jgi:hypothetical protein